MAHTIIQLKGRAKDITGKRFTNLVAIHPTTGKGACVHWVCKCDCGNTIVVNGSSLRLLNTTSCGCRRDRLHIIRSTTHGLSRTPTYRIWAAMIRRCESFSDKRYANYGGRGISVCKEWRESFEAFYECMGDRPKGLSIDRIDTDGNYTPANCQWANAAQQARNRTNNHTLTHNGETRCIAEWTEILGFGRSTIQCRLKRGWTVEKALTQPVRHVSPAATSGIN